LYLPEKIVVVDTIDSWAIKHADRGKPSKNCMHSDDCMRYDWWTVTTILLSPPLVSPPHEISYRMCDYSSSQYRNSDEGDL
jgi:hypothetical protein